MRRRAQDIQRDIDLTQATLLALEASGRHADADHFRARLATLNAEMDACERGAAIVMPALMPVGQGGRQFTPQRGLTAPRSLVPVVAGALLVALLYVMLGGPFPGRFRTEVVGKGALLLTSDTWTGRSWIIRTSDAANARGRWTPTGVGQ